MILKLAMTVAGAAIPATIAVSKVDTVTGQLAVGLPLAVGGALFSAWLYEYSGDLGRRHSKQRR